MIAQSKGRHLGYLILVYGLLLLCSVFLLLPLLWMLTTALKDDSTIYMLPPVFFPREFRFENFVEVMGVMDFGRLFGNTMFITVLSIIGAVLSCPFVAFGFARMEFKGKKFLFMLLIATTVLPAQVTMIPMYMTYMKLGWLNSYYPLILPSFFAVNAFFVFLLRQYFLTIPRELDESAYIDGCSTYGVYWCIVLPLCKPALTTVVIFAFLWTWNDFMMPLLYIDDMEKFTLTLGLFQFRGSTRYGPRWNYLMAASILVLLPCIVIFAVFQRYFIEGVVMSGIKG